MKPDNRCPYCKGKGFTIEGIKWYKYLIAMMCKKCLGHGRC